MRVRGGRPLRAHRHRRAARRRARLRGDRRACALYDIDDLQAVVARNLRVREAERARAEAIVEEEIQRFARWLAQLDVMPTIAALREHGDRDRRPGAGRERGPLGVRVAARPRAHRGGRARGDAAAAARADDPPRRRAGHGRQQLLRELFGLDEAPADARRRRPTRRPSAGGRQRPPAQAPGVRIGTRGSALALAQARQVADACSAASTSWSSDHDRGDRGEATSRQGALGARARAARCSTATIDCAVHSAKDVPGELADGLVIAAVPQRADPRDALCGAASLDALAEGARVGHLVAAPHARSCAPLRADLDVVELRGNVDTRLRKLAEATTTRSCWPPPGCARLGRGDAGAPLDELVPAAGQGCLAVTAARRASDGARRGDRPRARGACAGRRARAGARARGRLPHAGRRPRARRAPTALTLRAFVGRARRQRLGARRARRRGPRARWAPTSRARLLAAGAREVLRAVTALSRRRRPGRPRPAHRARRSS